MQRPHPRQSFQHHQIQGTLQNLRPAPVHPTLLWHANRSMPDSCGMSTQVWSAAVLLILSLEGPPLSRSKNSSSSRATCATPTARLFLPCFRPVVDFCTSDQFRQLRKPIKINRDRQSPAHFLRYFRQLLGHASEFLLRFSTVSSAAPSPTTLPSQKSQ